MRMNRSSLGTLKCDRKTLPKPSDEDASRGGGSAMVGKCSTGAVAQELICLRQQRTVRLDGDRNEGVPLAVAHHSAALSVAQLLRRHAGEQLLLV